MRWLAVAAVALAASGCSGTGGNADAGSNQAGYALENAAIATGVIADPRAADITGLYALDTDRICLAPAGKAFRIGISVDYGDGQQCGAAGIATRDGERLHIDIAGAAGCSFDGRFDGNRVILPGNMPAACDVVCSGRASLTGVTALRLSDSLSEAQAMRDARGRLLCGGGV